MPGLQCCRVSRINDSILYIPCPLLTFTFFRGTKWLLNWQNFRRFYLYIMTENVKSIILRHRHVLLSDEVKARHNLNEREIIAAATLPELDEAYTRRVYNFSSTQDLYKWSSSLFYFDTIEKPMIFINAKDDPLVPVDLLHPIKEFASKFITKMKNLLNVLE